MKFSLKRLMIFLIILLFAVLLLSQMIVGCSLYGGWQIEGNTSGYNCKCLGKEITTRDDSSLDGGIKTACIGIPYEYTSK